MIFEMLSATSMNISYFAQNDTETLLCNRTLNMEAEGLNVDSYGVDVFDEDFQLNFNSSIEENEFQCQFVNGEEDKAYPVWWKNYFITA